MPDGFKAPDQQAQRNGNRANKNNKAGAHDNTMLGDSLLAEPAHERMDSPESES